MSSKLMITALAACFTTLLMSGAAVGQSAYGEMSGSYTDASGVPGGQVRMIECMRFAFAKTSSVGCLTSSVHGPGFVFAVSNRSWSVNPRSDTATPQKRRS